MREFISERERPIILLNPGHGNEPYILAAAIGREVAKKLVSAGGPLPRLVMPLLYGDRQKRILREENPDDAGMIYLDEGFGRILSNLTFGGGDFAGHVRKVNANYDETEKGLNDRYRADGSTFEVTSLADGSSSHVSPKGVIGVIETASRVPVHAGPRYFAFPELLSRILNETMQNPGLGFDEPDLKALALRMAKNEADYAKIFVPWVNTFSYQHAHDLQEQPEMIDGLLRTYTPPMKAEIKGVRGNVAEGVYMMLSGTGSAVDANRALARAALEAELKVYCPPWENIDGAEKMPADIIADENVRAIMSRGGWGTGWQVMQLEKPWIVAPYQHGDDPEVYFNNKTIEALRLGKVMSPVDIVRSDLRQMLCSVSPGIAGINQATRQKFGTNDGIEYIAALIAKDLLQRGGQIAL